MDDFCFSIDVPVRNEWSNIDLLRTSVQNCFNAVFSDIDGCKALSMVTGELLENAMKYGHWAQEDQPQVFRLRVSGERGKTRVSVANPIRSDDPAVEDLVETLRWIESFPSPEAAYRARLLEIASADEEISVSKLGLVRVAYEGNCLLRASVGANILTVTAEMRI